MEIVKPGYDVEYDFVQPTSLKHTLETKPMKGLYLAGQVGTYMLLLLSLSLSQLSYPRCFLITIYRRLLRQEMCKRSSFGLRRALFGCD